MSCGCGRCHVPLFLDLADAPEPVRSVLEAVLDWDASFLEAHPTVDTAWRDFVPGEDWPRRIDPRTAAGVRVRRGPEGVVLRDLVLRPREEWPS